jgi:acetyl-CoA acetyltransferase
LTFSIRGQVAAVGCALKYYKRGTSPYAERRLILQAIVDACEDAGLNPRDLDGFASFGEDRHDGPHLVAALGCRELRWSSMAWGGGGGGLAAAIEAAAVAIATGKASAVAIYRGLAERDSGRLSAAVSQSHIDAHFGAHGVVAPAQICALRVQRMLEHRRVPPATFKALVKACYYHGSRNPDALSYGKMLDDATYDSARWISEPLRLFDCSRENDGAGALILVGAEQAAQLRREPVYLLGTAQGAPEGWGEVYENHPAYDRSGYWQLAERLWAESGIRPHQVDVVQVYENFSGQAVASLLDMGFFDEGDAESFLTFENLIAPNGALPINTAGGNLAEGFVHGIGLAIEAVRQLRGESPNPVPNARTSLLIGGPATALNSLALFGTSETL